MHVNWTTEKIKCGFKRFFQENNRLPTALEIDKINYLPSSRNIQKRFGGLEKLRKQFGFKDTHFGKGKFRSDIASKVNKRGKNAELMLWKILKEKFGEPFVHTEKFFDDSKKRVDFYVYSPSGNFCVDIFCTDNLRSMQSNINIKMKKYLSFPIQLFLIIANEDLLQEDLNKYSSCRIKKLPDNIKILTLVNFVKLLKSKDFYPNPIK